MQLILGKRCGSLKAVFSKLIRILVVSFLISAMLIYFSGRRGTAVAWDGVPITPAPMVALDLYTQKGGIGIGNPGGEFSPEESVVLYVRMTRDGLPAENETVAFNIEGPAKSCLSTAITNSSGIASVTFKIPPLGAAADEVFGTWSVTAQTGLDWDTFGDALDFEVAPVMHAPEFPAWGFLALAFLLTATTTAALTRLKTGKRIIL
jgi:hypothetical protein